MHAPSRALLLVVSGPSGSGKSTLCERLRAEFPRITYSISCTTRAPRGGEVDGVDYHFLDEAAFEERIAADAFLEHAVVHGHRYGTLKESVRSALGEGRDVLMDIDVQGAAQVRGRTAEAKAGDPLRGAFVDLFIAPPSLEALERRLRDRATDGEDVIARRMENARRELAARHLYRYLVVNDDLERAYDTLRAVVVAEHHRTAREGGPDA